MANDELRRACTLVLHDDGVSAEDVLCGSSVLPTGVLAKLSANGVKHLYFVAKALARNDDEVSLHVILAQRFGFKNRTNATVEAIEDEKAAMATHIELFFRDIRLSRADMWRMMQDLDGTAVYEGQQVQYLGTKVVEVQCIYISGGEVQSAYVSRAVTKPIFRSGSAHFTLLIQISKEMLEYWADGELMYERMISGYLRELFERWDALKFRHRVSLVLFGRPDIPAAESDAQIPSEDTADFFYVLTTDLPSTQWREILRKLKRAFNSAMLPREVGLAAKGNMLQTLHLAAMDFANDTIDPQLSSRGRSIIAITAGAGLFETDHDLLKDTTHLLMGNSIGVDIVALSPKPLYPVPLFAYDREEVWEYGLPHWVDISFWGREKSGYQSSWLLSDGVTEIENVALPLIRNEDIRQSVSAAMAQFDDVVFGTGSTKGADLLQTANGIMITNSARSMETVKRSFDSISTPGAAESETLAPEKPKQPSVSSANKPIMTRAKRDALPSHVLMTTGRKISLGPKGLAPSRGVASTTLSTDHAQHDRDVANASPFTPNESSREIAKQIRQSLARKPSQQSLTSQPSEQSIEPSKPIAIRSSADDDDKASDVERQGLATVPESQLSGNASMLAMPKASNDPSYPAVKAAETEGHWTASPWVTLLNPCNPKRANMRVAAQYRKWQHVFPRAVNSGMFKWASMCSPAALPLTTEYTPSIPMLQRHCSKKVHRIIVPSADDTGGSSVEKVLDQLIMIRLTHGFQSAYTESEPGDGPDGVSTPQQRILMSLGNTHHELQCLSDSEVQIVEYTRNSPTQVGPNDTRNFKYTALMRNVSMRKSILTSMPLASTSSEPDWSRLDDGIFARDWSALQRTAARMRLVLIPVEPPRPGHITPGPAKGLSDEERRIDGIQKLTQLWQRNRYYNSKDRAQQASLARAKGKSGLLNRDPNPLAIEYQTRDPSAVVNAYGPALTGQIIGADSTAPLFSESEMYHSSTFDVAKLVKEMQEPPPLGVEVRDRRWLARLHFKCFRGDEMVNWLLRVFKDLQTREDAVDIGNELMKRGVFTHVRHKHDFRDGNYFYQIERTHRTSEYPDNASMFNRSALRSVPATPLAEAQKSPMTRPVRDDSSSSGNPTPRLVPIDKKQLLLSEEMLLNVDSGKQSKQLEIVSLHYDRIHNPENCYHIHLEWVNATAMLISEAISRWTSLVESHGLRLVQLPLTEASKLPEQHPFDQPLPVKLAVNPPEKMPGTPMWDAQAFLPRLTEDPLGYQKALLRKMDFVLDLEAVASFTTKLDVRYSYGEPDYEMTQFVHKSGLVLAQICGEEKADFMVLPNRLACQKTSSAASRCDTAPTECIVEAFVKFCRDQKALALFYEEARKPPGPPSPFSASGLDMNADVPPIALPPHLTHRSAPNNIGKVVP